MTTATYTSGQRALRGRSSAFVTNGKAYANQLWRKLSRTRAATKEWALPISGLAGFTAAAGTYHLWTALLVFGASCFVLDFMRGAK